MCQKSVSKNPGANWSEIVVRPRNSSGSIARRSRSRISFSLKPNLGASTLRPSLKRRDLDDVFIVSFQSNISCVTVLVPSRVGIDEKRS